MTLNGHTSHVLSLDVLQNGYLVSGSWDNIIKIWNINDGTLTATLNQHTDHVRSLVVLYNGNLVSGSIDRTIKIFN